MTGVRGHTSGDHVSAHSPLRPLARCCLLLPFVMMLMGPPIAAGGQSAPGAPAPGQPSALTPGQPGALRRVNPARYRRVNSPHQPGPIRPSRSP